MIQHKYIYFIFGLSIGYLIGSISTLMIMTLLGIICWNWKVLFKFIASKTSTSDTKLKVLNSSTHQVETKKLKAWVKADVLADIKEYCRLREETLDSFIVKTATLVFKKDKEWIAYQRSLNANK